MATGSSPLARSRSASATATAVLPTPVGPKSARTCTPRVWPCDAAAGPPARNRVLPRYLSPRTRQTKIVGTIWHPDLSRINALHPDLILAAKQSERGYYRRLTKIAPTVVIDQRVNWKPNLRQDGEALGHADFAEK